MPKEKCLTKLIPKIYKRNAENIMLFAWVKAQKAILPTVTIEQSINMYFHQMCISIDEWDLQCAMTTYNKMQKDFYEDCQS